MKAAAAIAALLLAVPGVVGADATALGVGYICGAERNATPTAAGAVMLAGVGADTPSGHLHRFGSITVAGDTVPQWPMVIAPVPEWAGNMILGAGFMRLHRAWLPAGGSSIWFGPRVTDLGGKAATDR